jgi:ketosteroid isomerase-like protein
MKKFSLLALVSFLMLFACNTVPPVDKPAVEKAVLKIVTDYYGSFAAGDYETMKTFLADDFMTFDMAQKMDKEGLIEMAKTTFESMQVTEGVFTPELIGSDVFADNAILYYKLTFNGKSAGEPMSMEFYESALFVKVEDAWKIKFVHSTMIPPPTPEPPAETE